MSTVVGFGVRLVAWSFMVLAAGCSSAEAGVTTATGISDAAPSSALPRLPSRAADAPRVQKPSSKVVERARLEVSRGVDYDPAWISIPYPNGDPPADRGVCTDVVIRSLRTLGIDLQQRIHEDILQRPAAYTTVGRADPSIDHRRVTPMLTYLRAHATALSNASFEDMSIWQPGDIVVWAFRPCPSCHPDHVGLVSDRIGPRGMPLVLHNIGPHPTEDDRLDAFTVLGHFRLAK